MNAKHLETKAALSTILQSVIESKTIPTEPNYNYCYLDGAHDAIKTIVTRLHVADRLGKAFDVLPSNANIDKGRCGIGGTTLEIEAKRHSIFIVCTLGGIIGKANDNPEIFAIHGKMKPKDIVPELMKDMGYRKLFVTPDSFWKIIEAAEDSIGLNKLHSDYFVLYDEVHTAVTEAWRPNVLAPFKWIWDFKNKSFITATPCEINDPNFLALQTYRIEFHEPHVGKVNIIECKPYEISSCVDAHIANAPNLPGNLFFFYNSVTEIAEAIKRNGIKDCHIYCAAKGDNYEKLPEQLEVFHKEPKTGEYAKINFFTTRYFECFDLMAKNATIILVTDTTKPHTRVGISNKGVQAVGRIRDNGEEGDKPYMIAHITNHRSRKKMKSREEFKQEYDLHKTLVIPYNQYVEKCNCSKVKPLISAQEPIKAITEIDEGTNIATFSQNKLDQVINELVCNEEFNDLQFIIDAWERGKYGVSVTEHRSIPGLKKTAKKNRFRQLINLIHDLETNRAGYMMGVAAKRLKEIQKESPLAFEAYHTLSIDGIDALDYNEKAIRTELTVLHNISAKAKLLYLLDKEFEVGDEKLSAKNLTDRLQHCYGVVRLLNVGNPDAIQKAHLADFEREGWFKIKDARETGKEPRTYSIAEKLFNLDEPLYSSDESVSPQNT
ncbi:hypothetical protein CPT03_21945 [Pedobacter ginsengisoli]|uniref:Helicase/UvrB N-terminal domain-containing protein n=1 Tax=Pedobacter ginsengisoli TaxID=363852 RepID=A0A2D1UBE6_9SPHI|nr:hypothetical protein [Pedobacter ginsengisoli]ATP58940.1 hypothetical protein CPT03_21945 [Pedobacter ginsengisoli]